VWLCGLGIDMVRRLVVRHHNVRLFLRLGVQLRARRPPLHDDVARAHFFLLAGAVADVTR
jgi:hypothetical protein